MATKITGTFFRGDTIRGNITATNGDGTPLDLTGKELRFTGKLLLADPDAQAIISCSIGSGITVTNAAQGLARLRVPPDQTQNLLIDPTKGVTMLECDLQMKTTATNDIDTLARGQIAIMSDVTRAT